MRITRRGLLRTAGLALGAVPLAKWGPGAVDMGRRALATSGPDTLPQVEPVFPQPANGMNVILVVLDTLRKDYVGAYGNSWVKTPTIDEVAARGTRFARAVPESLPTIPVRRALHTGLRTFPFRDWEQHKGDTVGLLGWQRIPETQTTLAEILSKSGYTTALISDTPHLYGPSMNFHRGFGSFRWIRGQHGDAYRPSRAADNDRLAGFLTEPLRGSRWHPALVQYVANTDGRSIEDDWLAPKVFTEAIRLLEDAANLEPFFLMVDSFDPHEPWDPPSRYIELYDDPKIEGQEPVTPFYGDSKYLEGPQLERMKKLYAAEVSMVDAWLGRFLDQVDNLGLLDSTLLIVVSDHGILLGEHGITGKPTFALWPEVVDVPLLISHPDHRSAGVHEGYVSTHDVVPTILAALGADLPQWMNGRDLMPHVADPLSAADDQTIATSAFNDWLMVRTDRYELQARDDLSQVRLYDIVADPGRENLLEERQTIEELYELLVTEVGDPLVY
jgi:arylsulfatase A-like enzyme